MNLPPAAQRADALQSFHRPPLDLLVIGGGIVGAGIARDAACLEAVRAERSKAAADYFAQNAAASQEAASSRASWIAGKRLNHSSASSAVMMVRRPAFRALSRPALISS